jgi:hypothetical protein
MGIDGTDWLIDIIELKIGKCNAQNAETLKTKLEANIHVSLALI